MFQKSQLLDFTESPVCSIQIQQFQTDQQANIINVQHVPK